MSRFPTRFPLTMDVQDMVQDLETMGVQKCPNARARARDEPSIPDREHFFRIGA